MGDGRWEMGDGRCVWQMGSSRHTPLLAHPMQAQVMCLQHVQCAGGVAGIQAAASVMVSQHRKLASMGVLGQHSCRVRVEAAVAIIVLQHAQDAAKPILGERQVPWSGPASIKPKDEIQMHVGGGMWGQKAIRGELAARQPSDPAHQLLKSSWDPFARTAVSGRLEGGQVRMLTGRRGWVGGQG